MLTRLTDLLSSGIAGGLHLGAQACVMRDGRVVADVAVGEAAPGVPMRPETLMLWMSSGKPVTAMAMAQLAEEGRISVDDPVAAWLPEFAQNGKESVTLRHLLTHTGGFRSARFKYPQDSWEQVISAICAAPLEPNWVVGQSAGYHPQTSWFVLGEILRRVSGLEISDYMRQNVLDPLGMHDAWLGVPGRTYDDYAAEGLIAAMPTTAISMLRPTGDTGTARECMVVPRPGGNFLCPANQFVRFYEALRLGGMRVWRPDTVGEWTRKHRIGAYDQTFRRIVDFGLGFVCDSKAHLKEGEDGDEIPYGYGLQASGRAFGHSGYQSSAAFCDPERGLVAAICFNGYAGEKGHLERIKPVLNAVYEL